jgi:hypothetical protein
MSAMPMPGSASAMPQAQPQGGGGLQTEFTPPKPPQSQEPSKDAPSQQSPEDELLKRWGKRLMEVTIKKRDSWQWKRRGIVEKVFTNKEMLKGNHNIGFYPGTTDAFDPMQEYQNWAGADDKNADRSMDRRPHNFYQMVEKAYVASMSAQVPKTRATPMNADEEEDRETAKAFDRVMEIIERANKIKSLLRQELMEFFTSGCYFKFTRYVVDADRTGTHKQTVLRVTQNAEILPARYQCFDCGVSTPENQVVAGDALSCPNCQAPFGQENYFQGYSADLPVAEKKTDVPNGMVLWDVAGPMHIDADPDAPDLANTCLLNYAQEVSLGWLRMTFDKFWDKLSEGQTTGSGGEMYERQHRDRLTSPSGSQAYSSTTTNQAKPTYNRVWIQPMLFAEMDQATKAECDALLQDFPQGCMLAYSGDIPLSIRKAKLTDEWSHAAREQKGFGLFPSPAGDSVVPVQQRINDCISKIDEYTDRLACGILLANGEYIDTEAMNNKAMLPGILNELKVRKNHPNSDIQNMIFQVKAEMDAAIFTYLALLKQDIELLASTPPQLFGAGTQEDVETASGQAQQLGQAQTKLNLDWDIVCDEHAEAGDNAVRCAAKNMTESWQQSVTDETNEFRAEYVHLDQLKGSVHVEHDTNQLFPMTAAEIRAWWTNTLQNGNNAITQAFLAEPENMEAAVRFATVPGAVPPQGALRGKMLQIIAMLIKTGPIEQPDPQDPDGPPLELPSLPPTWLLATKYLDDLPTLTKLIPNWAAKHWDQLKDNQPGLKNLLAFYKQAIVFNKQLQAEAQLTGDVPQPEGAQA